MVRGFPQRNDTFVHFSVGCALTLGALAVAGAGCVDPKGDYEQFIEDTNGQRGGKPINTGGSAGAGGAAGSGGTAGSPTGQGGAAGGAGGTGGAAGSAGGEGGMAGSAGSGGGGQTFPDVNGTFATFCLSSLAGGDPSKTLKFGTQITVTGNTISIALTPLLTSATTLSNTAGGPVSKDGTINPDGTYTLNFGTVDVSGKANPISGSDIELGDTTFKSKILSADKICAELDGNLVKPFTYSLNDPGDICLTLRTNGDALPALPVAGDYVCP